MAEIPPVRASAAEQLRRVYEVTGCKTQVDLAALLGVRQSSVSVALKQGKLPDKWLVRLSLMGISVKWILTGNGPLRLPEVAERKESEQDKPGKPGPPDRVVIRNLLYCFPLDDLQAELQRRRAAPVEE